MLHSGRDKDTYHEIKAGPFGALSGISTSIAWNPAGISLVLGRKSGFPGAKVISQAPFPKSLYMISESSILVNFPNELEGEIVVCINVHYWKDQAG